MRVEQRFEVERPREEVVAILRRDEMLLGLFPDAKTEIVKREGERKTLCTHYRALGREGTATFHFDFAPDGDVRFEKICDGKIFRELRGEVRFEKRGGGTRVRIALEGRTKSFVPDFTIRIPLQEQVEKMSDALRRCLAAPAEG